MTSIEDIPIQPDRQKQNPIVKHAGIAISLVALAVSAESFWQSHRNALLQTELSRPLLSVEDALVVSPIPYYPKLIGVNIRVRNIGHLTAIITKFIADPDTAPDQTAPGQPNGTCFYSLDKQSIDAP